MSAEATASYIIEAQREIARLEDKIRRMGLDYQNACAENNRFREALTMIATEEPNGQWAADFAREALKG